MRARIGDPIDGGREVGGGRVIHRIHSDRFVSDLRAQRINECIARGAQTWSLGGAAGKHNLGIRARRRGREW